MSCSGAVFAFFPCTESVGISLTFTKKTQTPAGSVGCQQDGGGPPAEAGAVWPGSFCSWNVIRSHSFLKTQESPTPLQKKGFPGLQPCSGMFAPVKQCPVTFLEGPGQPVMLLWAPFWKWGWSLLPKVLAPPAAAGRATPTTSALQPCSSGFLIRPGISSCGRLKQCT